MELYVTRTVAPLSFVGYIVNVQGDWHRRKWRCHCGSFVTTHEYPGWRGGV